MGLDDAIAPSLDRYAPLALAFGTDTARRTRLAAAIRARSAVLYEDEMPVRALEAFILSATLARPGEP